LGLFLSVRNDVRRSRRARRAIAISTALWLLQAFFALDTNVTLTDHGTLHAIKSPGELFAKFTPQPKDVEQDIARRVFALVQQLDSQSPKTQPSVLTVFRLYCIEELSAEAIARKHHCSKTTIIDRLNRIRTATGTDPQRLRAFSSQFNNIEQSTADSRAKNIHRKNLIEE